MNTLIFLVLLLILPHVTNGSTHADKLDPRYVSQLRVELRNVQRPEQCLLLWKGISEKMEDVADYELPGEGADFELLADLSKTLGANRAYEKLGEFVDECAAILKTLPASAVESHTSRKSNGRSLKLLGLKNHVERIADDLANKQKLSKGFEGQTKLKIGLRGVELTHNGRLQVDKTRKELEHRTSSTETDQVVVNDWMKEKEQLLREVEKLKSELQNNDRVSRGRQVTVDGEEQIDDASKSKECNSELIRERDTILEQSLELRKQVLSRERELILERERFERQIDEYRREFERKTAATEANRDQGVVNDLMKEKEQLIKEVEKLKFELQNNDRVSGERQEFLAREQKLIFERDAALRSLDEAKKELMIKTSKTVAEIERRDRAIEEMRAELARGLQNNDQAARERHEFLERERKLVIERDTAFRTLDEIKRELVVKTSKIDAEIERKERAIIEERAKCSSAMKEMRDGLAGEHRLALKRVEELTNEIQAIKSNNGYYKSPEQPAIYPQPPYDYPKPPFIETAPNVESIYARVFENNLQPLEPDETLNHLKILLKAYKGNKDRRDVKACYKNIDRLYTVSKLKKKRCTKNDWKRIRTLMEENKYRISVARYLEFWYIQRQDYCARFYPNMKD